MTYVYDIVLVLLSTPFTPNCLRIFIIYDLSFKTIVSMDTKLNIFHISTYVCYILIVHSFIYIYIYKIAINN